MRISKGPIRRTQVRLPNTAAGYHPRPEDMVCVTSHFLGTEAIDTNVLLAEIHKAEKLHPYTQKAFGGWTSIPLRSVGGAVGEDASGASGDNASCDPALFADSPIMDVCPTIRRLTQLVAGNDRGAGVLKVRLLKLASGKAIGEHRDQFGGNAGKVVRRCHIPVLTNPKVGFNVNGVRYHLEAGELYVVDVREKHSVANHGETDRIHIVFDVVGTPGVQTKIDAACREK